MNSLLPTNCQQVSNNLHTQHKPYFQIVSGHQNSTVLDQIARMQLSSHTESGVPPERDHSEIIRSAEILTDKLLEI